MARRNDGVLDVLILLPWWVSVMVAGVTYIALTFVIPLILTDNQFFQVFAKALPQLAPYLAFVLLIPAPLSAINTWRKRRLLEQQTGIHSIRSISWKEFEELVAEAYRRKGFSVIENHKAGADGGVDIRLKKDNQTHLIQCKQWKSQKVGVSVIREMFGVMTAESASSVIVITSGIFTQEAKNFADGKPIDLVDGSQLESLIGQVQSSDKLVVTPPPVGSRQAQCPRCNGKLVLRMAKKGPNSGNKFYGCSSFPKCRYTE
ncbi:MAG: restriction endonuclease [Pseudomonadales bacterium]